MAARGPQCACCGATEPATKRVFSGSTILRPTWYLHDVTKEIACSIFCTRALDRQADPTAHPTYESVNLWKPHHFPAILWKEGLLSKRAPEEPDPEPPPIPEPQTSTPMARCDYCRSTTSKHWLHHPRRNHNACSQICARNLDKRAADLRVAPFDISALWSPFKP